MTWKEYDGVPVALYQPGDMFGDFEVYKNTKRLFSVMSISKLEVLVLHKAKFRKIFFQVLPSLGVRFVQDLDEKFQFLERVMQMIVDCVFHGKNIFEATESTIGFERKGSLLKAEERQLYLSKFMCSFQSRWSISDSRTPVQQRHLRQPPLPDKAVFQAGTRQRL